jgi:hypothetical protein
MNIRVKLKKNEITILSVCPPLNCLVELYEISYEGNAIQGDLDAIIFNPIASIMLKLLRFKVVR